MCYDDISGMELLKQYKEELAKYEAEQRELANAEKLFDLSITQYPELLAAQKEMRGLEQIYAIYEEQKVCVYCTDSIAKVCWNNSLS